MSKEMTQEREAGYVMQEIAQEIVDRIPEGFGFMVLVFPGGSTARANYISNCSREDMVQVLRHKADVLEKKLDFPIDRPIEIN